MKGKRVRRVRRGQRGKRATVAAKLIVKVKERRKLAFRFRLS